MKRTLIHISTEILPVLNSLRYGVKCQEQIHLSYWQIRSEKNNRSHPLPLVHYLQVNSNRSILLHLKRIGKPGVPDNFVVAV